MKLYYIGSDNKVYRGDGSRVMASSGRQVSRNSLGMILHYDFATSERVATKDKYFLRELAARRTT